MRLAQAHIVLVVQHDGIRRVEVDVENLPMRALARPGPAGSGLSLHAIPGTHRTVEVAQWPALAVCRVLLQKLCLMSQSAAQYCTHVLGHLDDVEHVNCEKRA
jgi:hypothetical protein